MKSPLLVGSLTAVALLVSACGGGGGEGPVRSAPTSTASATKPDDSFLLSQVPTPIGACGREMSSLTGQPLTESAFQVADEGLVEAIELARAGDANGAQVAFFGAPHNLLHDIDSPLRRVDEALAIRLCNEVVLLEVEAVGDADPVVIERQASLIREILRLSASALGIQPP